MLKTVAEFYYEYEAEIAKGRLESEGIEAVIMNYNSPHVRGVIGRNCTQAVIQESVTTIGKWAFAECSSLTSVTVPSNVSFIGPLAFGICPNLKTITVESGNSKYVSDNGILFSTD